MHAQAGIALAGTFSQQEFELPQGTEVSNPSIYVVVFNQTADEMKVQMLGGAPFGVEVLFDHAIFLLPPGEEQKVYITVKVTDDATPGEYEIVIAAEAVPKEGEGAVIATASAQKASLVVTGESAWVSARVVSPDGHPIKAQVRLFKVIQDRINEIALSETGTLEAKVSPGLYRVSAYIGSRKLAEETVEVRAGERKEITLVVRTVYFEQFGIEPNYAPDTELLAFVRMVYTLNNLYQVVNNAEVVLVVSRDDKPLEQVSLISFGRLDMGRTGGSYSYVPGEGWKAGDYGLKLELYIEGKLYTDSSEEKLAVAAPPVPAPLLGLGVMWWIAAGIAAIVIAVAVTLLVNRRRKEIARKRREELARKRREEIAKIIILLKKRCEELAPQPTVPPAATRNLRITSYDNSLKRGATCNVKVTFEYQGPGLTGIIRVAIGKIEMAGFDEKAYVSKQATAPETISWKTYSLSVSIATDELSEGTYSLYAKVHGAFPEIISPYLHNVVTIEEEIAEKLPEATGEQPPGDAPNRPENG